MKAVATKAITTGLFLLLSAFILAACAHTNSTQETLEAPVTAPDNQADPQATPTETEQETMEGTTEDVMEDEPEAEPNIDYEMELSNYLFAPNLITVEPGETTRIKLTVTEGSHSFNVDELGVNTRMMQAGEEMIVEIEVPADAAGESYQYYCATNNHRAMGMTGRMIVEAN